MLTSAPEEPVPSGLKSARNLCSVTMAALCFSLTRFVDGSPEAGAVGEEIALIAIAIEIIHSVHLLQRRGAGGGLVGGRQQRLDRGQALFLLG